MAAKLGVGDFVRLTQWVHEKLPAPVWGVVTDVDGDPLINIFIGYEIFHPVSSFDRNDNPISRGDGDEWRRYTISNLPQYVLVEWVKYQLTDDKE